MAHISRGIRIHQAWTAGQVAGRVGAAGGESSHFNHKHKAERERTVSTVKQYVLKSYPRDALSPARPNLLNFPKQYQLEATLKMP